jgi:uncharacterized protein (TIGR02246 family)
MNAAMSEDEQQIRTLVERWAAAVHGGDMEGVLANHAEDIVMFDVPPPHEGVRGIDAYRETWPAFFEWQANGASFEIVSLDVTAGEEVAFAHALLRCGMPQEPERDPVPRARLRLTLGLRKENGQWIVSHEHHSFADTTREDAVGEREVRAVHERWFERTSAKDLDGLMENIAEDVVSYEHEERLEHVGLSSVRRVCRRGLQAASAEVGWEVPDLKIRIRGDLAVAWGLNRVLAGRPGGQRIEIWSRGTRVSERRGTAWMMVHQHLSFPLDPVTGEASTELRP